MLDVDAINGTTSQTELTTQEEQQDVSMDAFFKLLMAQITHQDPSNPMEDQAFIAQMAQFQALDESREFNKNLEKLLTSDRIGQSAALIGRDITALGESGTEVSGTVERVRISESEPVIVLTDNQEVKIEDLVEIAPIYVSI